MIFKGKNLDVSDFFFFFFGAACDEIDEYVFACGARTIPQAFEMLVASEGKRWFAVLRGKEEVSCLCGQITCWISDAELFTAYSYTV